MNQKNFNIEKERLSMDDFKNFIIEDNLLKKYTGKDAYVFIPDGIKEIGDESFSGCSSLKSIIIPQDVSSIGKKAFASCKELESIIIPDSVIEIGDEAFIYCVNLESINIPKSLKTLGKSVFDLCEKLQIIIPIGLIQQTIEVKAIVEQLLSKKICDYKVLMPIEDWAYLYLISSEICAQGKIEDKLSETPRESASAFLELLNEDSTYEEFERVRWFFSGHYEEIVLSQFDEFLKKTEASKATKSDGLLKPFASVSMDNFKNIIIEDSILAKHISTLNLSPRSHNALIRAKVYTINDLLSYPKDDIIKIRNIGKNSVEEIFCVIENLNEYKPEIYHEKKPDIKLKQKIFIGNDGFKYIDIEIENLDLSTRAYNCLKSVGINYFSQLIDKLEEEIQAIPNMGSITVYELEQIKKNIEPQKYSETSEVSGANEQSKADFNKTAFDIFTCINEKINIKPKKFYEAFEQEYANHDFDKNHIKSVNDILKDIGFLKRLYHNNYIKRVINEYVLLLIRDNNYGCDENYLFDKLPECFKFKDLLNETLNDLLISNDIDLLYDDRFSAVYSSFIIGAKNYLNEREYDIIRQRTQGRTLDDIGKTIGITRERIRQIEAKTMRKLNSMSIKFKEDVYLDIFTRYVISKDDFKMAFDDECTYNYLNIRYGGNSKQDKRLKLPLDCILDDKSVPVLFKKSCEKAIYKNYVKMGGHYIPCTRSSIANFVLKTHGLNDLTFKDFSEIYFDILNDINKSDDPKLSLMDRGYENQMSLSKNVLWKLGRKFRYYNIDSYDFTDLLDTLNLEQYSNIEFSTLKFFRLYPDLMNEYDIRDEYELHNLLKKICSSDYYPTITFKRMPSIEFGKADRDNQVWELLITLAPISNSDFALEYEKEYGVSANTVLANYMTSFDSYFHNGIYNIDFPALPAVIAQKLKQMLTEDFYHLSTVREIYHKKFPKADKKLLNPYSLKSIGFRVFSNYILSDKYSTAIEYFNTLLTKDDIIDLERISSSVKEFISFITQLYRLKSSYEIIEFARNKYIHYRKLSEFGITKEILRGYCNDVLNFVGEGKYFTIFSIKNEGFSHELDELGFDDWFYTSLLIEDRANVSYQRIGGNKIMISGKFSIRFVDFLENVVYDQESLSIDIIDLSDILKQQYNLNVDKWKLMQIVKDSSMYYDLISEKIFADYDTYYEVV